MRSLLIIFLLNTALNAADEYEIALCVGKINFNGVAVSAAKSDNTIKRFTDYDDNNIAVDLNFVFKSKDTVGIFIAPGIAYRKIDVVDNESNLNINAGGIKLSAGMQVNLNDYLEFQAGPYGVWGGSFYNYSNINYGGYYTEYGISAQLNFLYNSMLIGPSISYKLINVTQASDSSNKNKIEAYGLQVGICVGISL